MAKKEFSYSASVKEIERILEKLEDGQLDVDELSANVKKASELIKLCREKLYHTEKEVEDILKGMSEGQG